MVLYRRVNFFFVCILGFFALGIGAAAEAQINITGEWSGYAIGRKGTTLNVITFVQNGTTLSGFQYLSREECTISGNIDPQTGVFSVNTTCPIAGDSSSANGTTNGTTMQGQWTDNNQNGGTFEFALVSTTLTPTTKLIQPPIVVVNKKSATFTFKKFKKVTSRELDPRAAKFSVQYNLTIRGEEQLKLISHRNTVSLHNLRPGNYTAFYSVTALSNGKPIFSTKPSPTGIFKIE